MSGVFAYVHCQRFCAITLAVGILVSPAERVHSERLSEPQRIVWGGPETLARNLDDLVRGNPLAVSGVVMSTSTHMGEGKTAGIVYTACVFHVDRWIPENPSSGSSITVDFVGGAYRAPDGRTKELRLSDRVDGHPEWIMEWPRKGQRLMLFLKRVASGPYLLGGAELRWQLLDEWYSSFELTPAGRVKPRGPNQGVNAQLLDKDVESLTTDVEAAFKRRIK